MSRLSAHRRSSCLARYGVQLVAFALGMMLLSLPVSAKVKLVLATGLEGSTSLPTYMARIDEFMRQNPDIEVEVMPFAGWATEKEKVLTMLATGMQLDVVHSNVNDAPEFLNKGIFLDVTKYAQEIKTSDYFLSDIYTVNGRIMGGFESHVQVHPVFHNVDLFAEAGLQTPNELFAVGKWNWDTFMAASKKLTRITGDGKVERFAARIPLQWVPSGWGSFRIAAGARLFSADGTRVTMDTPEMRTALQYFNELLVNRVMPRPGETLGTGDPLTNGKVAMDFIGSYRMEFYTKTGQNLNWDIAPTPIGPKGNATYRTPGADGLVVSSTKHPEEAWRLAKFFLGEYVQNDKASTRLEVPVLKKALASRSYLQAPPKNMKVIGDLLNRSISQPVFLGVSEATAEVNKALTPAFKGEVSLETAITEAQRLAQTALDTVRRK